MSWTPRDQVRLAALIHESDFISELNQNRPPLSGKGMEDTYGNAKAAEGWEDCIKQIRSMAEDPCEPDADEDFIDISKADPK